MSEPTTIENGNAGQTLPPAPLLGQDIVNALAALAMIDAAILMADASHNNSLCTEGVGFRYDPNSVAAVGTPAAKLRDELVKRGILA